MTKKKAMLGARVFPYGSMVRAPYKGWECEGTVLDHTADGKVRVALYTADEGNNVIRWYEVESLTKVA